MRRLVVASYNVHRCIGIDRAHDPTRVGSVLKELGADVIGLQEVDSHPQIEEGLDQIEYLARATGLHAVIGPTLRRHVGTYGNAILTRHLPLAVRRTDLSVRRREPRGALDIDLSLDGDALRIVSTHLGLRSAERRFQVGRLLEGIGEARDAPTVLLGDINEWLPLGEPLRRLHARFGQVRHLATFPSWLPVLALDRIWVQPRARLIDLRVHISPLARVASDHLPLRAILEWPEP